MDKRITTKTKESIGRIFSILNLTSSAKINKKKTSGAKITTTKLTSRTKEELKSKTKEFEMVSSGESINISIDCKIFSKLLLILKSEIICKGSTKAVFWEIDNPTKLKSSWEFCSYLSSRY